VPPDSPAHAVYLAWASVSGRTRYDQENRALLDEISRRGDPKARVYPWIDDDQEYLIALSVPGHFAVAIGKQNVNVAALERNFGTAANDSRADCAHNGSRPG
jgi:hypothetical protein